VLLKFLIARVSAVGADLIRVLRVSRARVPARLAHVEISVACDVDNPLLGPTGATAVYGPQKGVNTVSQRELLENGLAKYFFSSSTDASSLK
jgi:glycerate kinase